MNTTHLRIALGASLAAVLASASFAGATVAVDQHDLSFDKAQLTVSTGDIVNFTNNDKTAHNILINGEGVSLNSGLQQPGQTFSAPFVKPGTYQVTCAIHPKMKMTVVVK
jgi:plastocyanin